MGSHLLHHALGLHAAGNSLWLALVDVGTAFWFAVYVLAIVRGVRQKTYAIPLVAICANFSWELLSAVYTKAPVLLWRIGDLVWLALDAVVVWTLLRYGRDKQSIPEVRRWYYGVVAGTFALALTLQFSLEEALEDRWGFLDAYVISVLMSVLFYFMYFDWRDTDRHSYAIAWCKFLGNGLTTLGFVFLYHDFYGGSQRTLLLYVLCAACVLLDGGYVVLLARARQAAVSRSPITLSATPARANAA